MLSSHLIQPGEPWTWMGPNGPREYVIDSVIQGGDSHTEIVKLIRSDVSPETLPGGGIAWQSGSTMRGKRDGRWRPGHARAEIAA